MNIKRQILDTFYAEINNYSVDGSGRNVAIITTGLFLFSDFKLTNFKEQILVEKLTVTHLVKKYPVLALPNSWEPPTVL
jgi:hypothetical protein